MSSQSNQIPIKVRLENDLYYKLKDYVEVHFSKRNKIINEAVRRFLSTQSKRGH